MSRFLTRAQTEKGNAVLKIEQTLEGWVEIAVMFRVSKQTMIKRKDELQKAGAIFYKVKGSPLHKVVCAFPSSPRKWIADKSKRGEFF